MTATGSMAIGHAYQFAEILGGRRPFSGSSAP